MSQAMRPHAILGPSGLYRSVKPHKIVVTYTVKPSFSVPAVYFRDRHRSPGRSGRAMHYYFCDISHNSAKLPPLMPQRDTIRRFYGLKFENFVYFYPEIIYTMAEKTSRITLTEAIRRTVEEYIESEQQYDDDVQLQIDRTDFDVAIADPEQDLPECDYYPMMDLVQMSADDDGRWLPDDDAIASVVDEYVITD